tara:strand:- start:24 stop:251 length:228 start_codon:yes stop_codon:yes gene_type:complete
MPSEMGWATDAMAARRQKQKTEQHTAFQKRQFIRLGKLCSVDAMCRNAPNLLTTGAVALGSVKSGVIQLSFMLGR